MGHSAAILPWPSTYENISHSQIRHDTLQTKLGKLAISNIHKQPPSNARQSSTPKGNEATPQGERPTEDLYLGSPRASNADFALRRTTNGVQGRRPWGSLYYSCTGTKTELRSRHFSLLYESPTAFTRYHPLHLVSELTVSCSNMVASKTWIILAAVALGVASVSTPLLPCGAFSLNLTKWEKDSWPGVPQLRSLPALAARDFDAKEHYAR